MEPPSTFRRRLPQVFAALSVTLGGFSLGAVLGWTSPAAEALEEEGFTVDQVSWLASVTPLGALAAMLVLAVVLDRLGRRRTLLATAPLFVGGWMLLAFSRDYAALLVGRFVTGFCGGAFSTAAPVFIGETAEKDIRGALSVCYQLMLTAGILYVYVVGKWAPLFWLTLTCAVPPIIFFVLFMFVPESPMFLLSVGQREEAVDSLFWYRGGGEADITEELFDIGQRVYEMHKRVGSRWDTFTSRAVKRGLAIGVGLQVAQQFSGINVIVFYAVPIFMTAASHMDPSDCAIVVAALQVASALLSTLLVERLGRRAWLMTSLAGMGASLVVMGVYYQLIQHSMTPLAEICWVPLVGICSYLITCALGIGPLPWSVVGELFPGAIKGIASSICGGTNWLLCFVVSKTYPDLVRQVGIAATFWLYAGCCFVSALWVCFFVIETRNKPLSQIHMELEGYRRRESDY